MSLELDPGTVERALRGDREAFQELIHETWGLVYVFIQQRISDPERARDLTQETFLQAFDKRSSLRSEESFLSWILTIASRKVIDVHRQRSRRPEIRLPDADASPLPDPGEGPTHGAEREEESVQLRDALTLLDDRYRTVLILRYWSGLTPAQIARLLEEPEGTIRNRIFRAHARLRKILETAQESEPRTEGGYTEGGRVGTPAVDEDDEIGT